MDPNLQTTFIPKKPLSTSDSAPPRTMGFFSLIASIIFVVALLIAGGVYGYRHMLIQGNEKLDDELNASLSKFDQNQVGMLSRLDNRIELSKRLLNAHLAPTLIFNFLANVTVRPVRFSSFSVNFEGTDAVLRMSGEAESFAAVAFQAREFMKKENMSVVSNPLISNLNLDKAGNVSFAFSGKINPQAIAYSNLLKIGAPKTATTSPATTAAATTTTATSTNTSTTTQR